MKTDLENNAWKAEAPYLASLPVVNPFRVPEGYFGNLPDQLKTSLYAEKLKAQFPETGFTVPEDYFTSLEWCIQAETSAAALPVFGDQPGFSTPEGYFQGLQSRIMEQTVLLEQPAPAPKAVRLWHTDLVRYAAAACFILMSAFGLYLNQQHDRQLAAAAELANEQMLYDIDEQDIIDHVEGITGDKQTLASADLESYLLNNYSQSDLSTVLN